MANINKNKVRFGNNVFRGEYLHQLMEILNLYFGYDY